MKKRILFKEIYPLVLFFTLLLAWELAGTGRPIQNSASILGSENSENSAFHLLLAENRAGSDRGGNAGNHHQRR